jgi:hypothetical protein
LKKAKKLKSSVKDLEKEVDELKKLLSNKVDCSLFDEEIDRLKNLIN